TTLRQRRNRFYEILAPIVDGAGGTQALAEAALLLGARRGEHRMAKRRCQLDGGRANTARTAMDEQRVLAAQSAAVDEIAPDSEAGLGQGSRIRQGHAFRN